MLFLMFLLSQSLVSGSSSLMTVLPSKYDSSKPNPKGSNSWLDLPRSMASGLTVLARTAALPWVMTMRVLKEKRSKGGATFKTTTIGQANFGLVVRNPTVIQIVSGEDE